MGKQQVKALGALQVMQRGGLEPGRFACHASISACEKGKKLGKALALLEAKQRNAWDSASLGHTWASYWQPSLERSCPRFAAKASRQTTALSLTLCDSTARPSCRQLRTESTVCWHRPQCSPLQGSQLRVGGLPAYWDVARVACSGRD